MRLETVVRPVVPVGVPLKTNRKKGVPKKDEPIPNLPSELLVMVMVRKIVVINSLLRGPPGPLKPKQPCVTMEDMSSAENRPSGF